MATAEKRKLDDRDTNPRKPKKQWSTPKQQNSTAQASIHAGDAGIWATCDRGRESKCVSEMRNLFQEYAERLYGDDVGREKPQENDDDADEVDVEAEIQDEVQSLRKPGSNALFQNVKIEVQCVLFFKTKSPIDPVPFVHEICRDAMQTGKKKTRFLKRLTPVSKVGKATEEGLEELAKSVLAPYFHTGDGVVKSFAIRPTLRNHNKVLNRDSIIKRVAEIVGPEHKVDLSKPDFTILIEVYKFHCGMSVVGGDFEELRRFNLDQIYHPSASEKDAAPKVAESVDGKGAATVEV